MGLGLTTNRAVMYMTTWIVCSWDWNWRPPVFFSFIKKFIICRFCSQPLWLKQFFIVTLDAYYLTDYLFKAKRLTTCKFSSLELRMNSPSSKFLLHLMFSISTYELSAKSCALGSTTLHLKSYVTFPLHIS